MLRGDRDEEKTDITYFMTAKAERGGIVCLSGVGGSGAALDSKGNVVSELVNLSGAKPVGILLNDVVDVDLSRYKLNEYKNEVNVGGKVTILRRGWVVTNKVQGAPTAGAPAYVGQSGLISATNVGSAVVIGEFMSAKDAQGYAKVNINLPATR